MTRFPIMLVLPVLLFTNVADGQENEIKTAFSIPCDTPPETIAFSNDGTLLVVGQASFNGGMEQPTVIQETNVTEKSRVIQEKEVRLFEGSGNLRVYRADQKYKLSMQYSEAQWVWDARFSPDNKRVISASDRGLRSRTLNKNGVVQRFQTNERALSEVSSIAFSNDGKFLASSRLSIVDIWDYQKGQLLKTIKPGGESAVCFLSDSRFLVTAEGHNRVKIWNVETGQMLVEQHAEMGPLDDVDVTSDDQYVVVASEGSIKLFKLDRTGDQFKLTERYGKRGGACVDISPDNRLIATGSLRGNASIYDLKTGKPVVPLDSGGPRGYITAACFAPDSKTVAIGGKTSRGPEGKPFLKIITLPGK